MNFSMRSTSTAHHHVVTKPVDSYHYPSKSAGTLEGLVGGDLFPDSPLAGRKTNRCIDANGSVVEGASLKIDPIVVDKFSDVSDKEGWITIPHGELPDGWSEAPDIDSLRSLDRSFVLPGEQVCILACLSASKQDAETITPYKVAKVLSKNGIGQTAEIGSKNEKDKRDMVNKEKEANSVNTVIEKNVSDESNQKIGHQEEICATASLLRMEDHKRHTENLLEKFKDSHFFVRIAESGEPLWSKKTSPDLEFPKMDNQKSIIEGTQKMANNMIYRNALIDRGKFEAIISGGAARNGVRYFSLSNGDIVLVLEVNVGVNFYRDPIIEILQFEKYRERNISSEKQVKVHTRHDPYGDLLRWLLPVNNTIPSARSLSSLRVTSGLGINNLAQTSASSNFQPVSHVRSYSMSSLPQNIAPPRQPAKLQSSKSRFDLKEFSLYSSQAAWRPQETVGLGLLSFRGVSLEQERFSVHCGLDGIYIPGKSWRRKLEIVQPVEIHSFAFNCNADNLLSVQIKNVSPSEATDVVIYIDAITIIIEEVSKGGPQTSIPITCIEAGNAHQLPNLALRRGEQHSFILKPAYFMLNNLNFLGKNIIPSSRSHYVSNTYEGRIASLTDQYAIMVSCRCNYTESRLFFKQPTSWQPRVSKGFMISVTSDVSRQYSRAYDRRSQLPIEVLTLQVSNLTPEDLTATVLAPASFGSPPVRSLCSPTTAEISTSDGLFDSKSRTHSEKHGPSVWKRGLALSASESHILKSDRGVCSMSLDDKSSLSNEIPSSRLGCTHLWLQSRVPLGCVPAHSTTTVRLELLPLTNKIITLDSLRIYVKEKGLVYIPEHSLKINTTLNKSAGIL